MILNSGLLFLATLYVGMIQFASKQTIGYKVRGVLPSYFAVKHCTNASTSGDVLIGRCTGVQPQLHLQFFIYVHVQKCCPGPAVACSPLNPKLFIGEC